MTAGVLGPGDQRNWEDPADAATDAWFGDRSIPVYLVRGNHDFADPYRAFARGRDISGLIVPLAEHLFLAGVGWHGEYCFDLPTDEQLEPVCDVIRRQARRLLSRRDRLILLTHYPAPPDAGLHAKEGSACYPAVSGLIHELRPMTVIQGHIHSWFESSHKLMLDDQGPVLIVNPGRRGAELAVDAESGTATLARYLPGGWEH